MADKTQGPVVYTALIMPLSSHATFPKPTPTPPGGKPPATGGEHPDNTLPGELPHPEHPIYYPLPPGAPVDPGFGNPWFDPHPDQGLPTPQPPQGGSPPKPDHTLPGDLPHPEHPIVLPPETEGGWDPVYIWGGGPGIKPPLPIPPDSEAPEGGGRVKWKAIWTPSNGWQTVGVILPGGEHVSPSKKK